MSAIAAETDLHWAITVPPAVLLGAWILWYWRRLGAVEMPDSRRRIRRASILVMLITLPLFVQATSFLDADRQQVQYIVTWLLVMFCIGLVLLAAVLDLFNTLRLARRQRRRQAVEAAVAVGRSLRGGGGGGEGGDP